MSDSQKISKDFFLAYIWEAPELCKTPNGFMISLTYNYISSIKRPRIFIRADGSVMLKLNSCTYYPVRLPEQYRNDIHNIINCELAVSSSDEQQHENMVLPVSHVMRFPEPCELAVFERNQEMGSRQKEEAQEDDENTSDEEFELNRGETDNTQENDSSEDDIEDDDDSHQEDIFEHVSCLQVLEQWLEENKSFSLRMNKCADFDFCLLTDNRSKVFLIVLFKRGGMWLADEETFCDCKPLYFTTDHHVLSPVFTVGKAAEDIYLNTGVEIHPVMLIDDDTLIINEQEMFPLWQKLQTDVCSCSRNYSSIKSFSIRMAERCGDPEEVFTPEQIAAVSEQFQAFDESICSR